MQQPWMAVPGMHVTLQAKGSVFAWAAMYLCHKQGQENEAGHRSAGEGRRCQHPHAQEAASPPLCPEEKPGAGGGQVWGRATSFPSSGGLGPPWPGGWVSTTEWCLLGWLQTSVCHLLGTLRSQAICLGERGGDTRQLHHGGPSVPFQARLSSRQSPPTKAWCSTLSGGISCSVLQADESEAKKQHFMPLNSL